MSVYEKLYAISRKRSKDGGYKRRLDTDPAEVLRNEGFYIPAERGTKVSVNDEGTLHVVIPSRKENEAVRSTLGEREMDKRELADVVGGVVNVFEGTTRSWFDASRYVTLYDGSVRDRSTGVTYGRD